MSLEASAAHLLSWTFPISQLTTKFQRREGWEVLNIDLDMIERLELKRVIKWSNTHQSFYSEPGGTY